MARRDEKLLGLYSAGNAYGATVRVRRRHIRIVSVALLLPPKREECGDEVPMPRPVAQAQLKNASWALIGALREPYVVFKRWAERPTYSEPYDDDFDKYSMTLAVDELIAYDTRTGRVFYRSNGSE